MLENVESIFTETSIQIQMNLYGEHSDYEILKYNEQNRTLQTIENKDNDGNYLYEITFTWEAGPSNLEFTLF